jgi:hypothetical protein
VARELERVAVELVGVVYGGRELSTPDWLKRPGRAEAGRRWRVLGSIYHELTGMELPEVMPPRASHG